MKNVRFILLALVAATIAATAAIGLVLDPSWAVVVATAGTLAVIVLTGYVQTKTMQLVAQRLTGLQKQNERVAGALQAIRAAAAEPAPVSTGPPTLPKNVERAFEDLSLASRALTVPQAHFDQLLRTISANTVRTELALSETVDEIRSLSSGPERRHGSAGSSPLP